jgi:hypothetical protein
MWSPTTLLSIGLIPESAMSPPRGAFLLTTVQLEPTAEAAAPSGSPENALDLVDGNPINLGDLGNRHAVFYQVADARKF